MAVTPWWRRWEWGDWVVALIVAATLAFIVWAVAGYEDSQTPGSILRGSPCAGLEGADLDACIDAGFADDLGDDPREPFGGGAP